MTVPFSADLYARLAGEAAGDFVCSPYSVFVALGMLAQGARGGTAAEILAALGARDAGELATGIGALERALKQRPAELRRYGAEPERIDLASASRLWGHRGVRWEPAFLDVLEREFGSGLHQVDHGRPEQARRVINAWASEQTRERIPEILPEGLLTSRTRLASTNALSFKAPWAKPFWENATGPEAFHRLDGSTVAVPMMRVECTAGYAEGPGWVAADLPYQKDEFAMAVVVAEAGRFAELERGLTGAWLGGLLSSFEAGRVGVRMPRWTTRSGADLGRPLAALGVAAAFDPLLADFSGMTTQERLFVSAAVHEGFVAVDEGGTEAAAVTTIAVGVVSAPPPPDHTVVADRPFLYVVHDRPTGTPLFIGRVVDPPAA